jgi:two-component system sensor histidine kinase MprB
VSARRRPRERRLLLRSRIALTTAVIVALAIAGVCSITWFVTAHNLRSQLDQTMLSTGPPPMPPTDNAALNAHLDRLCRLWARDDELRRFEESVQLLRANGTQCSPIGAARVETTPRDRAVTGPTLRDGVTRTGTRMRVLIRPMGAGNVLVTSRSLDSIDATLDGLANELTMVSVLGVLIAGTAGLVLTRNALRPMQELTRTAERIARTEDLQTRVEVSGRDEVGRLGRAFASMTEALAKSRRLQRELVANAAHELRTPLTSLRTNIDLLARSERSGQPIPAGQQTKLVRSMQSQVGEFSELVDEVVTLAKDERELQRVPVHLDVVIDQAVRRASRRSQHHSFEVDAQPWETTGDPAALERIVVNLLDNAIKFAPPSTAITIRSGPGWLTVSDQGPGVPAEQRSQVFGRFWRAPEARQMPGSGLGLAIVAETVAAHGGTVRFTDPPTGRGAHVRVEIPSR